MTHIRANVSVRTKKIVKKSEHFLFLFSKPVWRICDTLRRIYFTRRSILSNRFDTVARRTKEIFRRNRPVQKSETNEYSTTLCADEHVRFVPKLFYFRHLTIILFIITAWAKHPKQRAIRRLVRLTKTNVLGSSGGTPQPADGNNDCVRPAVSQAANPWRGSVVRLDFRWSIVISNEKPRNIVRLWLGVKWTKRVCGVRNENALGKCN